MRGGRWSEALAQLEILIEVVDRIDFEYEEWLRAIAECFRALGRNREAMACAAYLGIVREKGEEELASVVARAREGDTEALEELRLQGIYLSRGGQPEAAARYFEAGAMPVHQAIELERAGGDEGASPLWRKILERGKLDEHPYETALVQINYALGLHRLGEESARSTLAEAVSGLEQVADGFETDGMRERAFDCYQLLARIGLETGRFENVAEGYLNSVRILRDDALKLDALRLYEAFVSLARRFEEHHAVAGILREAADYCTRVGLPYADDLRLRSGEAWSKAAEETAAAELPVQLVENAYLSAAEAFVSVRAFKRARATYEALAKLGLKSGERYRRLLKRLREHAEDPPKPVPVPEFLKRLPDYEEVWYVDLAEWELEGDPVLVAAGVMADRRFPDFVRRHSLLLVLELGREKEKTLPLERVIERLRAIRAYPVIAVLEQLYRRGDPSIRAMVARAMGSLRFKRSFMILGGALRSEEAEVRGAAAEAISNLFFPHAFDRLRSIFEARDLIEGESARLAALRAIGRINSVESMEFLCDRLREGQEPYLSHSLTAIQELGNAELTPFLRQQLDLLPPVYRGVLEDLIQRLDGRKGRRLA